jgi:glycosyltransferase involved in cell wall biosynthesis
VAELVHPVAHLPSSVVGCAVDARPGDPGDARRALGLGPNEPYVLCLGKVERAKGSDALARMWGMYRQRRGGAVPKLVFVGPVEGEPAPGEGVIFAGRQPEAVKWGALAGCELLVAPSVQESFSLVVVEAWLAGRPVLVDGRCQATVENCRRCGGGLWYDNYGEFEVALDCLLDNPGLRSDMAVRGRALADRAFAWPAVLDRWEELAERVVRRWSGRAR